ncbi:MAG: LysR substrate-binding domain-containing protein [Rhodospirillales bacterium]
MSDSDRSILRLDADLISLRALIAIVDAGSFSAAGRRIGRSQSAVSLQIAKLEARLRTKLLRRSSRAVMPTAAGETLLAYARRIVALADEAALAVGAPDAEGHLRIGFAEYLVPKHLHELLARFRRAHPKIGLELKLGTGSGLRQALDAGLLDVMIAGPDGGEGGRVLLHEPMVWISGLRPAPEDSAAPLSLIAMDAPCSYRRMAIDALDQAGLAWRITVEANALNGVQSAVRAGLGVSAIARSAVDESLRVVESGLPTLPATATVAFTAPRPHRLTDRFLAFLEESLPA